jgi:hypothetical protein
LAEPVQSPGRTGLWDWEPERPLVFQPTVSPPQASPTIHELYHAAQAHRKDHFWDDGSANRAGRARDTLVAILRGPDQVPSPGSLQETADPDLAPRPGRPTDPFQYPWWHNDLGPGSGSGLDL